MCNGIEVVEVIYANYADTCANAWNTDVAMIMFYPGYDTASEGYIEVQGELRNEINE